MHLCAAEPPIARVMAESAEVLREEYTKTGLATDEDIDHYVARAHECGRFFVPLCQWWPIGVK